MLTAVNRLHQNSTFPYKENYISYSISTISHQGQNIKENIAAGVIIVEQSLVIRRVSRSHSGRYSCTAVNAEGSGVSNTVQLRVMCKWHIENVFVYFM